MLKPKSCEEEDKTGSDENREALNKEGGGGQAAGKETFSGANTSFRIHQKPAAVNCNLWIWVSRQRMSGGGSLAGTGNIFHKLGLIQISEAKKYAEPKHITSTLGL